jgi:hypothetical protein
MGTVVHIDNFGKLHSLRKRIKKADDALVRQFDLILRFRKNSRERDVAISLLRVMLETHALLETIENELTKGINYFERYPEWHESRRQLPSNRMAF